MDNVNLDFFSLKLFYPPKLVPSTYSDHKHASPPTISLACSALPILHLNKVIFNDKINEYFNLAAHL
jgi:hypothetical protein